MMEQMKRLLLLVSFSGALGFGQDLSKVRSVYLLPMRSGLDQYLANQLTHEHVFQVVTDPKSADAMFTDTIGANFEDKLADLESNPEPAKKAESDDDTSKQQSAAPVNKLPDINSSFGRGKGTVFLVNPKSHQVVWSSYRPPKSSNPDEMNRTASDIVSRLKRDLKTKETHSDNQ
jgi:hypothetical protein